MLALAMMLNCVPLAHADYEDGMECPVCNKHRYDDWIACDTCGMCINCGDACSACDLGFNETFHLCSTCDVHDVQVSVVIAAIDAIGTVEYTQACKEKIDAATATYNALSTEQQQLVTNFSTLRAAQAKYRQLKAQTDRSKANLAISGINAIGTVTCNDAVKLKIEKARAAYNELTEAGKALVTNYETLKAAQEAYEALKAQNPEQPKEVYSVAMTNITLQYKKSAALTPTIVAEDGAEYSVSYTSSNDKVAKIDGNRVTGLKKGSAIVTCTVIDEMETEFMANCTVTVNYTWWQWIIIILLFGWIWY